MRPILRAPERETFREAVRRQGLSDADLDQRYMQVRTSARVCAAATILITLPICVWSWLHLSPLLALITTVFLVAGLGQCALYVLQGWSLKNRALWWERQEFKRRRRMRDITPRPPARRSPSSYMRPR